MIRRPPRSPLFPYTTLSRSREARPRRTRVAADALDQPRSHLRGELAGGGEARQPRAHRVGQHQPHLRRRAREEMRQDRKSTRLNSSHSQISYAVFCLKKKNKVRRTNVSNQILSVL